MDLNAGASVSRCSCCVCSDHRLGLGRADSPDIPGSYHSCLFCVWCDGGRVFTVSEWRWRAGASSGASTLSLFAQTVQLLEAEPGWRLLSRLHLWRVFAFVRQMLVFTLPQRVRVSRLLADRC